MQIAGKLLGANKGYLGHRVEALTAVTGVEAAERANTNVLLVQADVADDGSFELGFTDPLKPQGTAEVSVRAPTGERIALVDSALAKDKPLRIEAKPRAAVPVDVEVDPFAASLGPVVLSVQLVDKHVERSGNQLVSIWGVARPERRARGEPPRVVLGAGYTDARGLVSISIPRRAYEKVEAVVPADLTNREPTAFSLDENNLPGGQVTVAVSLPESSPATTDTGSPDAAADTEDCSCKDGSVTPRTPDHGALVGATGVYATDLGVGTCPSPAIPNRTLEEYRYYSLVRTTDPVLFGTRFKRPKVLSDLGVQLAGELAYGIGAFDTALIPKGGDISPDASVGRAAAGRSVDALRLSSPTYRASGLINARAWRETGDLNEVQKAIQARAGSLSEDTLRQALADPDGFTPMTLMTAERSAAFESLGRKLDLHAGIVGGRKPVSADNMPSWDAAPRTYQAATIAHGHVLEWRQVWRADGYSLGDLLYSLPLAPGQKRKIVVLDWDRRESAIRSESRSVSESFSADLSRDRAVSEIVNSTISESIRAGSKTNTWAAGGGLGLGIPFSGGFFGLGVAGGGGGSSSTAWQDSARSLGAYAGQQLSDRTQQASSAVRSQRASVVVGQEQSEALTVTSEVVANYNHCHAMTVEYFEVLEHFRVDIELAAVSECLFVPLQMTRWDDLKALRWRDCLQTYLRDRGWRGGFDAAERIITGYADTDFPPGRYADELVREMSGECRIELDIVRPRPAHEEEDIDAYLDSNWKFWEQIFGVDSAAAAYNDSVEDRQLADRIFARELAPRVARGFCDRLTLTLLIDRGGAAPAEEPAVCDFTMVSDYYPGREHLVSFRVVSLPAAPFTRAQLKGIRIGTTLEGLAPGSRTILRYAQVNYRNDYRNFALVSGRRLRDDIDVGDPAFISTRSLSRGEEFDPRANDLRLRDGLIKHLNEFIEHYHHVIWWRMDPCRRFMLLDGFIAPHSGNRSVATVTENRLLDIIGNSLVLPVAPGFHLDPNVTTKKEDEPIDLLEAYRPKIPFPPKRISIPTRGVHAEAILGECNSCEKVDDTRFWDWASEPTGDEPPEILTTSTSTRRQTPADTTPSTLATPIVAIQNAPAAPDPSGLTGVAALLGQMNLFKDVTGLEGNQANAIGAFQRALQTANFFGKLAAGGAKAAHANRQGDRVLQKLKESESSGLISKDDAKKVAGKLFGVMNSDVGGGDKPLSQETSVADSLRSFLSGSGKKTMSVSQGTGNQKQTVDAKFDNGSGETPEPAKPVIDSVISGVPAINQVKSKGCWAAAVTMLRSFQDKQTLDIAAVLDEAGAPYPDMYENNTGLQPSDIAAFMEAFHLQDATLGALTAEALAAQLKDRGPLWVVVDEDPAATFSVHARVITGVRGGGEPDDTNVIYNDPATGTEQSETLAAFIAKAIQLGNGLNSAFGGYSPMILSL